MNFKEICEGLHLLARPALATVTCGILGWVVIEVPEVPIEMLGMIASPALSYIAIKWTGNVITKKIGGS